MPSYNAPKSWIDTAQESLDERSLDQSPLEAQIKGFGSGALEGLKGLMGQDDIVGLPVMGMAAGMGAKMLGRAPRVGRMAGPTLDLLENAPVKQVTGAGMLDDVNAVIGDMRYNLAKVPQAGTRANAMRNMPHEFQLPPGEQAMEGLKQAVPDPYQTEMFNKYVRK